MAKVITIVGGGLAGLSMGAALARKGLKVRLFEAGRYPRHRVCGEFICGVSAGTLEGLGVGGCMRGAERLEGMVWYAGGRKLLQMRLPCVAAGLSRWMLDARLCGFARDAGCEVREGVRVEGAELERGREGVVVCSGRLRGRGGLTGLKAHFEGVSLEADLEMHVGRGGYVGLSRVEGGRVNVCGIFRRPWAVVGGRRALERSLALGGMGEVSERLAGGREVEGSRCAVAGVRCGWVLGEGDGVMRVGDALAMIPPFTGNGMSMAFEGAECAVGPLVAYAEGGMGWGEATRLVLRAQRQRFGLRMGLSGVLHPFLLDGYLGRMVGFWAVVARLTAKWLFERLRCC